MPRNKLVHGLFWDDLLSEVYIEMAMIRYGGHFKKKDGSIVGEGLAWHYKRLQQLLWPDKVWHAWNELLIKEFAEHRIIGVLGPAASGKTREASDFMLCDYYCYPDCTTVLVSSTERETLEMRAWGEIKRAHKSAKAKYPWLPGELIESRQRLVTDERHVDTDGRDFRNGICGVACKKGGSYTGLGAFAGIHNKRTRLVADEGGFMPVAYVDALSNLNKAKDFKCIVIGNPKDTTDALGKICEPSAELGGWDGGIDQTGGTKTWPIRFPHGICVQLVGSDSPNLDGSLGIDLISQEQINADIQFYGKESLQFTMMDEARMPRGQALRRIVTRQFCLKHLAMEEPVWKSDKHTKIGFMDAAYRGVGGDRCVFGELQFGVGLDMDGEEFDMLTLIDTLVVPVKGGIADEPEDQIANFVKEQCEARQIPPQNFYFDSTGRGSLMSAFARLWSVYVNGVEFGGKPSDRIVSREQPVSCDVYFSKRVSELWFLVRLIIEAEQFRGMTEEVMNEGCMREWTMVGGNKVDVEPKKMTKVRMGRSPDLFDALAVGCEGARQRGFVVARLGNNLYRGQDENWKEQLKERAEKLRKVGVLDYSA